MSSILRLDVEQKNRRWTKATDNFFTSIPVLLVLFVLFSALISSAVKSANESNGFTVRLAAAYLFIAISQAITIFLSMGANVQKIVVLYRTLQTIVDSEGIDFSFIWLSRYVQRPHLIFPQSPAHNDKTQEIYWHAEQKYRKYARIITTTALVYDQLAYSTTFLYSIYWILIGNTDASAWPLPYELSVPFDTKTVRGWYLMIFISNSLDMAYLTCLLMGTTQFIGSYVYITAICEHFDSIMQTIETNVERNQLETNSRKFLETRAKINVDICKAIETHIMIYE